MFFVVSRVCVIGAGYVGGPTGAVLAVNCPELTVHVVDLKESHIKAWNPDRLPVFEVSIATFVP